MGYEWVFYGLLSAFTAALVAIFGKMGLEGVDSNTATFVRAVIMVFFLLLVLIFQGKIGEIQGIVRNFDVFKFIILSGVAGALSWLFYFIALRYGQASQVVPIDRLSVVFTLLLGFLFLGESISLKTGLGALIIVAGALIIAV